jgi:hypothetical protein
MRKHEFILEGVVSKALGQQAAKVANSAQTLNFAHYKPDIIKKFTQALDSGQPANLEDTIYNLLRNTNATTVGTVDQLGYTQAQKAAYKAALYKWPKNNGPWAQKDFGPPRSVGQGSSAGGHTQNYYATIVKDRANLDKYMNAFPDLDRRIQQLAQQTGQPISYKTNSTLTALASDNDNFKVYYYDPKLKPQIEAMVTQWLQANGIQTGTRTHTHGVDVGGTSFGQRISKHVSDSLDNLIKQNGTKYTPEQYYQWLGKYFQTLINQVK